MKRFFLFFVFTLCAGTGFMYAQERVTLDAAIKSGAQAIENKLAKGAKVVVLNFNAPSERLSDYVIDEMMTALVNNGKLVVVDRQNLALIQQEMNFQMSGEVSDSSAQEIGMKLGAQSIISGSFENMGNYYRVRFRTIEVVSAAIQTLTSANVASDNQIRMLMGNTMGSSASADSLSPTGLPNGLNYTTNRKIGAGFLNWIYGAGSFTMKDWVGGAIVGGTELLGTILFIVGANTTETYGMGNDSTTYITTEGWGLMAVGLGIQIGGMVYGHIRPFQYDKSLAKKNGTYYALGSNPLNLVNVSLLPGKDGVSGVNMSFSFSY